MPESKKLHKLFSGSKLVKDDAPMISVETNGVDEETGCCGWEVGQGPR